MTNYEIVLIIRQDIPSAEVDKIISDFSSIISSYGGEIAKTEYWGLRSLAYDIENNKRAHYYLLCIKANNPLLLEFNRKAKLNEHVLRVSIVKVEQFSTEPSPVLRDKFHDSGEETVDVTVER
jgi:small subunit ribosomal protein S6